VLTLPCGLLLRNKALQFIFKINIYKISVFQNNNDKFKSNSLKFPSGKIWILSLIHIFFVLENMGSYIFFKNKNLNSTVFSGFFFPFVFVILILFTGFKLI